MDNSIVGFIWISGPENFLIKHLDIKKHGRMTKLKRSFSFLFILSLCFQFFFSPHLQSSLWRHHHFQSLLLFLLSLSLLLCFSPHQFLHHIHIITLFVSFHSACTRSSWFCALHSIPLLPRPRPSTSHSANTLACLSLLFLLPLLTFVKRSHQLFSIPQASFSLH